MSLSHSESEKGSTEAIDKNNSSRTNAIKTDNGSCLDGQYDPNNHSSSNNRFQYVESEFVTRDFTGRRGQKTTISDVSVRKRVLLVCVYNKKGTLITHDIIYRLFMKYGEIHKILIFEKCKNWKIFVEMETLDQADRARQALDNYSLFDDGSKMTVYYAKVDQIVFQNNNSGGVDYRELKRRKRVPDQQQQWEQMMSAEGQILGLDQNDLGYCGDNYGIKQIFSGGSQGRQTFQQNLNELSSQIKENSTDNSVLLPRFLEDKNHQIPNSSNSKPNGNIPNSNAEKHRNYSFDYSELIRNFESVPNVNSKPSPLRIEGSVENNSAEITSDIAASHELPALNENTATLQIDKQMVDQQLTKKLGEGKDIGNDLSAKEAEITEQKSKMDSQGQEGKSKNDEDVIGNQETKEMLDLNGFYEKLNLLDEDNQIYDKSNRVEEADTNKTWEGGQIDPSQYVNPLYILENKKSRVIYVRGLEKRTLTTRKIYNLFSNFGNIELILFFTEKRYCLIQFETQEDATTAKEQLDSLKIEQNTMRIFYSNYENIKENQENEKQCEIFKGDKSSFRFRNGKQISVNPVTSTLHVSNLKADTCKADVIVEKFSPFGVIEAFHPINASNKYMCHVKFASAEEATNALVNLHEEEILGRKIHISFTRTRISPMTTPDSQIVLGSSSNNNNSRIQAGSQPGFRGQNKGQKQNLLQSMNSKPIYHRGDSFQEINHAVEQIFQQDNPKNSSNNSQTYQGQNIPPSQQQGPHNQFQQQIWGYQNYPQQYADFQQMQASQNPNHSQNPIFYQQNGQPFFSSQNQQYSSYPSQPAGYNYAQNSQSNQFLKQQPNQFPQNQQEFIQQPNQYFQFYPSEQNQQQQPRQYNLF